jgi:DnaJ-related protein SCJ1
MCPQCHGEKVVQTQHTLAVHIPGGAPEGFEEVFAGEADENVEWEAGDVIVRVRSQRREGEGDWARHESGILGRVTLSAAEVSDATYTSFPSVRPSVHQLAPRG